MYIRKQALIRNIGRHSSTIGRYLYLSVATHTIGPLLTLQSAIRCLGPYHYPDSSTVGRHSY